MNLEPDSHLATFPLLGGKLLTWITKSTVVAFNISKSLKRVNLHMNIQLNQTMIQTCLL